MRLGPTSKLISEVDLEDESLNRGLRLLLRVALAVTNELEGPGQTDERK